MAKSENDRNRTLLENYFKKGNRASRTQFEQLLLTEDGKVLEQTLLAFLYDEVDNIPTTPDINYLFKAFVYLEVLVEKYPELNRKKIERKLLKIIEKIERIEEEKIDDFYSVKKVENKIGKLKDLIYNLKDKIELKKDNYYELLNYFIFEIKNVDYVEKILQTFHHTINAKNENGESIYYIVINKYIELISTYTEDMQPDILYYKNINSLFKSNKQFNINNVERAKLLQNIYYDINFLNKNDKQYQKKKEFYEELKEILKNDNEKTTIKKIASYYNIQIDFDEVLINELKMYQSKYKKFPDRRVIDDYMITIDGKNTDEIDDGLTAKVILGNSVSEHIVHQAMILTGSEVGNWFKGPKRDYPCLLRVHEISDECVHELQEVIDNHTVPIDKEKFERLYESIVGIYPKAYYDLKGRHDGLNLDHHCHITSPLRRGADIVQEYALDTCYFTQPTDKELYELEKVLIENKNIINAQNNAIDYFLDDCRFQKRLLRKAK